MNCHQVLSGACNAGDQCFAVGSVEGIPFTAYAAGCNIVILASNFERVQIIPGAVHNYVRITSLDCSTDTGKVAAAYGAEVCIFEPTPLIHTSSEHGLEYRWVQTGRLTAAGPLSALSWNLEGTRLLTGGALLQLWHQASAPEEEQPTTGAGVKFEIGGGEKEVKPSDEEEPSWVCVWRCHTATPAYHLAFSPDGTLFATSGKNDRLVKIWYQNKVLFPTKRGEHPSSPTELNYGFIYVAHPRALTHLSWRKTSKYMPKGSVGNMLVTSCLDNICRVWAETLPPEEGWGPPGTKPPHYASHHRTNRHKHRFMQRLKHMKTCFHIRRTAQSTKQPGAPIPTLPSTYSAHDFHNNYHNTSSSAGLHFHLAASINAETDIPLVPSIGTVGNTARPHFILHWLHNKEMHFTLQAETMLHDLIKKIFEKEDAEEAGLGDHNHHPHHPEHPDDNMSSANHSHPSLSNTTSINSIATDVTCTHLPDSLDTKIEALLRDWHHSPDLLFSIHPIDGSFLIWVVEWLDEYHPGSFRQAQVSFSTRIPNAFPLGDATTMSTAAALYHTAGLLLHVRQSKARPHHHSKTDPLITEVTTPLASVQEEKEEQEWPQPTEHGEAEQNGNQDEKDDEDKKDKSAEENEENKDGDVLSAPPCPVISMVTNHANGTLNLWQLTFADKSKFSQVLSIGHASRASGHRFRVNDITCHPVLPLLLTTSHHNIADKQPGGVLAPPTLQPQEPPSMTLEDCSEHSLGTDGGGFCSELILWRVDAVGPLSRSGGVGELARINSPHPSAFSNVAWIPTLLPSTTLGNLSNSPSACFVASDGESLRVYQAVIDARTLLAEVATSERRHRSMVDSMMSISTESSMEGIQATPLHDRVKIVSQQSTARPGCVIRLDAIADATHDWQNTQLLHVFQEQLITGERMSPSSADSLPEAAGPGIPHRIPHLMESELDAMVDLQQSAVFEEPFYIVVLERTNIGTTVHMWRLVIASQPDNSDVLTSSMMYVPDSALVQDADDNEGDGRKRSVSIADAEALPIPSPPSHVAITTTKVCSCELPLPQGIEVIHASPAAGHLSSASIYPACFAPYIITTACSDSTVRFWKCEVKKNDQGKLDYSWCEWEMINKDQESAIDISGQPLNISAAYSGRIACAYKHGKSFTRPGRHGPDAAQADPARYVNLCVAVYECESTGGSEWLLEDTIHLRNIHLPRVRVDPHLDLSYLYDTRFLQKKQRLTQVLQTLSHEDLRSPRNGGDSLSSDSTKSSAGLLAVPSFSTLQSLRRSITENGNTCPLTQKHLVQLDWVSKEDGSHILTVAVGSKVLLFTPVSSDLAQANMKAMKESLNANRPILRKASSLAAPHFADEIRWMKLRAIDLRTADGLPPLPMQISWVRDGILVVGMDSEMHVYSQWKPDSRNCVMSASHHLMQQESEDGPDTRNLRDEDLRPAGESRRRLAHVSSMPHLSRVSSINLQLLDRDNKKRRPNQTNEQQPILDYMPDYGLFEASRIACPVLPQYHPKQLMELLNSGKIRWVKAILAHLVRCIRGSFNSRSSTGDDDSLTKQRGWSRTRTLSVSYVAGAVSPMDNVVQQIPEELQLDYAEITSIPPLPLWTLLVADKERPGHLTTKQEAKDYNVLFDGNLTAEDDLDQQLLQLDTGESPRKADRRPSVPDRQGLSHFGPRQGSILSRLLTHTHLPGLSSLDQMHLLALADTVSTCNTDFAERFAINADKTAIAKENMQGTPQGDDPSTDALDDCGLRFLLAMKHYSYLLRCLPLTQRAPLQRQGVGHSNIVWAFHSESCEQLLSLIPSYNKGNPKWATLKELGAGWWLRSPTLLRTCMERVARAAYQEQQDPMDAALIYLAMRKKALLWGLFRSRSNEKMTAFFSNNFAEERWRKAALKNAYALLGKQRFEHAAAFFLLGGSLKDALGILLTRLGDLQLAMIIARLYDGDNQMADSFKVLLYEEILGCDADGSGHDSARAHPDPFMRSMALWLLRDYSGSLATLLVARAGQLHPAYDESRISFQATGLSAMPQADPNVFNFYVYLRTHPMLVRQYVASQGGGVGLLTDGEEGITRLERRLYFTTAHGHFKAGCPALALEVLSKLPAKVLEDSMRLPQASPAAPPVQRRDTQIDTGMLEWAQKQAPQPPKKTETVDWGASPVPDWGAPPKSNMDDELELNWDDDDKGSNGSDTPPLALKLDTKEAETKPKPAADAKDASKEKAAAEDKNMQVDIMAQQLKFVACLKILMEELSTLATGFEVDGGHLRYQLYIWLEREVEALRQLCGYATGGAPGSALEPPGRLNLPDVVEALLSSSREQAAAQERPTLHQVLLQEKQDFEAKVQRAVRRKKWLKANETLLRTLLSYCSLQGAGGGGLASVRMELVLLLQELQQEKSHQQLLSPLPFPTTLPLLSASVACSKTVVADPVRHLQAQAHDMLQTMICLPLPLRNANNLGVVFVLRDLAVALSACIYQSLCDSDTFSVKHSHPHQDTSGMECLSRLSGLSTHGSHLMGGRHRRYSSTEEAMPVTTPPNKWPGVTNLRSLVAREDDGDTPRLNVLLCEAFVACFMALLVYALRVCDAHLLYRLSGKKFTTESWATLYGGGVKRLLRTASISNNTITLERPEGVSVWTSLRAQRAKLNMRLLGAGSSPAPPGPSARPIKEGRPTYREHFVPPVMSMVSYLLIKPQVPNDPDGDDYDSAASIASDADDSHGSEDEEDVFGDPLAGGAGGAGGRSVGRTSADRRRDNMEHSDPTSYSWAVMRLAVLKVAQAQLQEFLNVAGIEMQELAVSSPLVHGALRCLSQWQAQLTEHLASREAPIRYIPACFPEEQISGPPINKYRCLLEKQNTPFSNNLASAAPARRLWNYLVQQELVQDIFIRAVFAKHRPLGQMAPQDDCRDYNDTASDSNLSSLHHGHSGHHHHGHHQDHTDGEMLQPVRIIHKEQDSILAFCLNQVGGGLLAVSSPREVQEMDISLLLRGAACWASDECEVDLLALTKDPASLPDSGFLIIQHQNDKSQGGSMSPTAPSTPQAPSGLASQTGRGASVMDHHSVHELFRKRKTVHPSPTIQMKGLQFPGCHDPKYCRLIIHRSKLLMKPVLKHKVDNIKRMSAHPLLPLYLTGGQDGSVQMWEWGHAAAVCSPRPPGTYAKVTRVRFSQHGNKFGVADGDGNLSLWQVGLASNASRPFFTYQCHNKGISDFVFLGSCSLVATAGHSSESKNVAVWDSLMPQNKSLVYAFTCHDTGANCVGYAAQHGLLVSGGRKGDVSILDARQRIMRHRFSAHDAPVKCLTIGPNEDIFATGAADGDIKVWGLSSHGLVHWFPGEHAKSSFFKQMGQGVTQLLIDGQARLFSCGADGTMKVRQLPDHAPTHL